MTAITVDHIFQLTKQLPREQRKLLIVRMERELANEARPAPPMTSEQALEVLADLREAIATLPQPRLTAGELLEADRRDRECALLGHDLD